MGPGNCESSRLALAKRVERQRVAPTPRKVARARLRASEVLMFTHLITGDVNLDLFVKVGSARLLHYRMRKIKKYLEEDVTHFEFGLHY